MTRILPLLAVLALPLAGCDRAEQAEPAPTPAPTSAISENPDYDPDAPGAGNEYSYLTPLPLRDGDADLIAENMQNVGGCSFHNAQDELLLVVGAPDLASTSGIGVVRLNGKGAVRVDAAEPGTAYVDGGPTLVHAADGTLPEITVVVAHEAGEGVPTGIETVEWPAQMTVSDPDAEGEPIAGRWSCGV